MKERTGQDWDGETSKAAPRRMHENFYVRYINGKAGIDIGCADDPIDARFDHWDFSLGSGDATHMQGVPDGKYETVYASHILEHLHHPITALRNWWRILKPGGHLIVCVPHRDLYEQSKRLPSRWNSDHKTMWLPFDNEFPARGLMITAAMAFGAQHIKSVRVLDDDYRPRCEKTEHPQGEYSIELIARKP